MSLFRRRLVQVAEKWVEILTDNWENTENLIDNSNTHINSFKIHLWSWKKTLLKQICIVLISDQNFDLQISWHDDSNIEQMSVNVIL